MYKLKPHLWIGNRGRYCPDGKRRIFFGLYLSGPREWGYGLIWSWHFWYPALPEGWDK